MLTKQGVEALLKVRERILNEPTKFNMFKWFSESKMSECGTAACIGGWLVANHLKSKTLREAQMDTRYKGVETIARQVLGTPHTGSLFYSGSWVDPFWSEYDRAMGEYDLELAARIAADYIVYWIKSRFACGNIELDAQRVELPEYTWFEKGENAKRN